MRSLSVLLLVIAIVAVSSVDARSKKRGGFFRRLGQIALHPFRATGAIASSLFRVGANVGMTAARLTGAAFRGGPRAFRNLVRSHRRSVFRRRRSRAARMAAAARLASYRVSSRAHWRRTSRDIRSLERLVSRGNRGSLKSLRRFNHRMQRRLRHALSQFGRCRTAACRFVYSHSMQRTERAINRARRLASCMSLRGGARRRCSKGALKAFVRATQPGRVSRALRRRARWARFTRGLRSLGRQVRRLGRGLAINTGMARLWAHLRRHRADVRRRRHACSTRRCRAKTARALRRQRRMVRLLKRLRRCGRQSNIRRRSKCVRRVLARMSRLAPRFARKKRSHSKSTHLPKRERELRSRERRELTRMHRRARRCAVSDVKCTVRMHRMIRRRVRQIARRRRQWRIVHRSSGRARREFAILRVKVHRWRGRLHACNGRRSCVRRVLKRLIRRTRRALGHFRTALRGCKGRECRVLVNHYSLALNRFLAKLRKRMARTSRRVRTSVAARRRALRRRTNKLMGGLAGRISAFHARFRTCKGVAACIAKARAAIRRFFRSVRVHLTQRAALCTTSACRTLHATAIAKLRRLARATVRYNGLRIRASVTVTRTSSGATVTASSTTLSAAAGARLTRTRTRINRLRKSLRRRVRNFRRAVRRCRGRARCLRRHRRALQSRFRRAHKHLVRMQRTAQSDLERTAVQRALHRIRRWWRSAVRLSHRTSRRSGRRFGRRSGRRASRRYRYRRLSSSQLSAWGVDAKLSTPVLADNMYRKLVARLAACPTGTSAAALQCRRRVMRRFRKVLHAREKALIKLLRWRARARLARAVEQCDRTTVGNPAARATCVTTAQNAFASRLQQLRERDLEANKRNGERQCESATDVPACNAQVEAAYQRDLAIAKAEAAKRAAAVVAYLQANGGTVAPTDPFASLTTLAPTANPTTTLPFLVDDMP